MAELVDEPPAVGFFDRNFCSHSWARDSPEVRALKSSSMSLPLALSSTLVPPLGVGRLPMTSSPGEARDSRTGVARATLPRSDGFSDASSSTTELAP